MSESRGFPAELLSFLAFGMLGVAVTAAALAGFAQLMAGQGCSGSVVPILATTAVCMGSLLCALAAAFRKKARGLLTGLLQSTFLAVPLALSAVWNGTAAEPAVVCRLLAVLLCGCIGGLLGVTLRSRRAAPPEYGTLQPARQRCRSIQQKAPPALPEMYFGAVRSADRAPFYETLPPVHTADCPCTRLLWQVSALHCRSSPALPSAAQNMPKLPPLQLPPAPRKAETKEAPPGNLETQT